MLRSSPSTRRRTCSEPRNGSTWMSVARNSTAFSNISLTARTTGAPLAMSRRPSRSSSSPPLPPISSTETSSPVGVAVSKLPIAARSVDSISSKVAISRTHGRSSVSSMVRSTAASDGSAIARWISPPWAS